MPRLPAGLSSFVLLVALGVNCGPASARSVEATPGSGLMLRLPGVEAMLRAPTVDTRVEIRVTGLVARTRVVQQFTNPSPVWAEGVYVFPLPEDSAVDRLRMRIGERVIEGELEEKAQAKRTYETAKRDGKRASLVEQERPSVFTTSVANIDPGGRVEVAIEYQEQLRYDAGRFSLRFPLVVAPRFIPGEPLLTEESVPRFDGTGWAPDTQAVPDASRVTPPVLPPEAPRENPVSLSVALDAGFELASVSSPSHAIDTTQGAGDAVDVTLSGPASANRDFVLEWRPALGKAPRAALLTEDHGEETYALLMVLPPAGEDAAPPLQREVIFVIDVSGSMDGASIREARNALDLALVRLRDGDRFNVFAFNNTTWAMHRAPVTVNRHARERARRWVADLQAGGGTHIASALEGSLNQPTTPGYLRQVVFLTDGAVGNEDQLFAILAAHLGTSRLFTVGIGSAPNAHFMRRAATIGRGAYTFIGDPGEVGERMDELFSKLERPVMRDVTVRWPEAAGDVEAWPERLPDLYAGEPLILTAKLPRAGGEVVIEGERIGTRWRARANLVGERSHSGIHALWAREKIAALERGRAQGANPQELRSEITGIALEHGLVSRYTSLVAVEKVAARPPDAGLESHAVPAELPAGWDYEKVFGRDAVLRGSKVLSPTMQLAQLPRTATAAPVHLMLASAAFMLAALLWRRGRRC